MRQLLLILVVCLVGGSVGQTMQDPWNALIGTPIEKETHHHVGRWLHTWNGTCWDDHDTTMPGTVIPHKDGAFMFRKVTTRNTHDMEGTTCIDAEVRHFKDGIDFAKNFSVLMTWPCNLAGARVDQGEVYQEPGCHGNKVGQMLFGQDMMQIDSPKPSSPEPGSPEPGSPESKCMTMNLQSDASFFGDLDSKEFVFGELMDPAMEGGWQEFDQVFGVRHACDKHVEWSGTVNRSMYLGNAAACPTQRADEVQVMTKVKTIISGAKIGTCMTMPNPNGTLQSFFYVTEADCTMSPATPFMESSIELQTSMVKEFWTCDGVGDCTSCRSNGFEFISSSYHDHGCNTMRIDGQEMTFGPWRGEPVMLDQLRKETTLFSDGMKSIALWHICGFAENHEGSPGHQGPCEGCTHWNSWRPAWGRSELAGCFPSGNWQQLSAHAHEIGLRTGGLGKLMQGGYFGPGGYRYQVWMCQYHPCAYESGAADADYDPLFCWVFDEMRRNFVSWGRNKELMLTSAMPPPAGSGAGSGDGSGTGTGTGTGDDPHYSDSHHDSFSYDPHGDNHDSFSHDPHGDNHDSFSYDSHGDNYDSFSSPP